MRSTQTSDEGPIRALLGPLLIFAAGGVVIWGYLQWTAPPPAPSAALAPAASAPTAAPAADAEPPPAPTSAAVEAEMDDVRVSCPLSRGVAPSAATVSSSWHDGAAGFGRAEREQSLVQAPMLVYVFTDWCPYCKGFEREVLGDSDVDRYLRSRVIKVRVNPELGAGEEAVKHRLQARGYPSIYLVLPGASPVKLSSTLGQDRRYAPREFIESIDENVRYRAESLTHEASARRRGGDAAGALELLDRAIALRPEAAAAYRERGLAHEGRGDLSRAFDDFGIVLALDPRPELYGYAGEALGRSGRNDEAVACWTQQLEQQPGDARALLGRSRSHQARGDRARARADADEACRRGEPQACRLVQSL
jgi:hypothetical protein